MPPIPIRSKLQQGDVVGVVAGPHNTDLVDFLGQLGPDGVWLESEHGPVDWSAIGDFSRACDLWGMASIVRVNTNEPWLITRALDCGASGVCVPHVATKAAAERVVAGAKFAPLGQRGMYRGRRSYGVADYLSAANEETLVVILIEDAEALPNLAEMLTVEHVDVFHVAPQDLAQSMGYPGHPEHPKVQAAIDRAIGQIVDAGRVAGTSVIDESLPRYLDLGVRFVYTSWLPWLARGAQHFTATLKARH